MSCLIDKLRPSWSTFTGDLYHKQDDFTLVQVLKVIRIEDQHRQSPNSNLKWKPKSTWWKISLSVNLWIPRVRSSRHPFTFIFLLMQTLLSNFYNLPSSNLEPLARIPIGRFCYFCGRVNHLAPQYFNWKMEPVKAQPEEIEKMAGIKPTFWNWTPTF